MFKKVITSILAASLIITASPAMDAEAKAKVENFALPVSLSADAATYIYFSVDEDSTKSEEYAFSMEAYYPKTAIAEKTAYGIDAEVNVYGFTDSEVFPCAKGVTKTTFTLSGDSFTFGGASDAANYMSMTPVGSYYCLKIKSLPVKLSQYAGGGISKYADIQDDVLVFPALNFSGKLNSATKVYVDNISVKNPKVAYENDMEDGLDDTAYIPGKDGAEDKNFGPVKFSAGSLSVKKEKVTVKVGKTLSLGAVTDPAGKITYKSSNKKVVTVTAKGVIKGKKKGKAKITITANGLSQVVTVTVK